jgi:adenylate cyclase
MNKTFGTTICISDSVFETVASEIVARPLRRVQVKGRKQEFMIYELLGITKTDDAELKARPDDWRLNEMTWVASGCFERGDVAGATRHYREILELFPNDPVAKAMLRSLSPSLPEMPDQGADE